MSHLYISLDDNEHSYELIQDGTMVTRYHARDTGSRESLHDIYESIPQNNAQSGTYGSCNTKLSCRDVVLSVPRRNHKTEVFS